MRRSRRTEDHIPYQIRLFDTIMAAQPGITVAARRAKRGYSHFSHIDG
jgi:hypothetical protein